MRAVPLVFGCSPEKYTEDILMIGNLIPAEHHWLLASREFPLGLQRKRRARKEQKRRDVFASHNEIDLPRIETVIFVRTS